MGDKKSNWVWVAIIFLGVGIIAGYFIYGLSHPLENFEYPLGEKTIPNYNGTLDGGYSCYPAQEGIVDCYFTPNIRNGTDICVACGELTYHFLCFENDQCLLFEVLKRVEGGIRSEEGTSGGGFVVNEKLP